MKKFILLLAVLPLVSLADFVSDDTRFIAGIYTYYQGSMLRSSYPVTTDFQIGSFSEIYLGINSGFRFNRNNGSLSYPALPSSFQVLSNATENQFYNLRSVDDGYYYSMVKLCPSILNVANSVVTLFRNGYTNDFINVWTNGSYISFNCTPSIVFSGALSSTNLVYRRIVLDSLSSIASNVQNINLNVEGLQSAISQSNEYLSNISGNVQDISEDVDQINQSASTIAENSNNLYYLSSIDENVSAVVPSVSSNGVLLSASTNLLSSVTNLLSSSVSVQSSSTNLLSTIGESVEAQTYSMNSQFGEVKEMYGQANRVYLDKDTSQLLSSFATQSPLDPNAMPPIGSYDERQPRDVERLKALQELARRDFNNAIDAVRDPDSPYFDKNINDVLNNPNALSQISSNSKMSRSFTTNQVLRPLTNAVEESTHKAATNITHKLDDNLQDLKDFMNDGVNVRIIYPQAFKDVEAVHVHDDALDVVVNSLAEQTNMLSLVVEGLSSNTNTCNFEWQTWLDHFDYWVDGIMFSDLYQLTQNIYSNQYLLFKQYSTFSESSEFWNRFSGTNTPEVLTRWGFSSSNRNFWEFLSAAQMSGIEFVSFIMDCYSSVTNLVNENQVFSDTDTSSFSSAGSKIISSIPTTSQIEDEISRYTNAVDVSFIETATNFLASTSNRVDSALGVFHGSDSLPSHLVFISSRNNGKGILAYGIEISLESLTSAFQILRGGVAFGYSLVFLILLPKFCLFWIRRFYAVIMSIFGMMKFD